MNASIWIVLGACLAGCYMSACHTAIKTFSRKRLADLLEQKGRGGRLEVLTRRQPQLLLLTGFLRTLATLLVVLGVVHLFEQRWGGASPMVVYGGSFLAAGALLSIFVVAIPVSWARYRRERLLAWSVPVLSIMLTALLPLTSVLHLFDPVIRRISGADLHTEEDHDLSDEVLSVVEDHQGKTVVDEAQKEMLEAIFDLPNTTAGEIMTPRTEVHGIPVTSGLDEVKAAIQEYGHSRFPVFEENLDHIIGMLYAKDLIRFVGQPAPFELRSVLREAFMVPESKSVRELLAEFKARKVHVAILLDEYGGTAGLVTIEDILEELVGEIQDEYEKLEQAPMIQPIDAQAADVDARIHIDDLNDQLDIELPEDEDYDTLGGFVVATLGHIPDPDESFEFENQKFTVTAAERTKVLRVRVERLAPAPAPGQPNGSA